MLGSGWSSHLIFYKSLVQWCTAKIYFEYLLYKVRHVSMMLLTMASPFKCLSEGRLIFPGYFLVL